jgi:hypothetical protein
MPLTLRYFLKLGLKENSWPWHLVSFNGVIYSNHKLA